MAGDAKMDAHRFHRWNVLSGVLWVSLVLTPGFLAGRGIEIAGGGMAWHGMAWQDTHIHCHNHNTLTNTLMIHTHPTT